MVNRKSNCSSRKRLIKNTQRRARDSRHLHRTWLSSRAPGKHEQGSTLGDTFVPTS